jgi:hypothetical protein
MKCNAVKFGRCFWRFGGTYCIHPQGTPIGSLWDPSPPILLPTGLILLHLSTLGLHFYREDGTSTCTRETGRPGFDSRQEKKIFSLHSVQTDSGAHAASYPMDTGGSFPGGKAAGAWSWPLTSIQCGGQE